MKNHNLLMIPGPVEFDAEVLAAMGAATPSHVSPEFIETFARALEQLRDVFLCPDGQPFILAGSGTLAMDSAGANLVEPGDKALVVSTGYFSDRFGQILERYGAKVTYISAPIGARPSLEQVEKTLKTGVFKLMVITHVDTSTGVINDIEGLANLAQPFGTLVIVDGVCSVAGEELRMTDWNIDLALTASQKAIGVPPGLAIFVARPRVLAAFQARKTPVMNYYADWTNWLPIMQSYAARKPAYFATPAVNLVSALKVSLTKIIKEGLQSRFQRHSAISQACKAGISALGLDQVPTQSEYRANTMTAPRYPEGMIGSDFLTNVSRAGVILAGGLHPQIRAQYFRIGHMGEVTIGEVLTTLAAIESALNASSYRIVIGSGVAAAQKTYNSLKNFTKVSE
jgi:alanine-glyoxylate transaminase / serine-glyoxylate transaminase / serine-pyruvate transaminase